MNNIALITGASSGFGEATARKLAASNWQLVLVARRTDRLEALKAELGESVIECISLDVTDREKVKKRIEPWNSKVDLLVNNAGLAVGLDPAWNADLDDWDIMVDTNIKGLTYVTRALLSGMVERGRGHVINLGSIAGSYNYPGGNTYGATKAFVERFSLNLRADLHGTGVRVTNIEPGFAETEFSNVRFKGDGEKADLLYKGTQPLQPDDIAESILWCANLPEHVNINRLEIMPVGQSFGPLPIVRD
ncbi:MAG: SDR family oxidoreductase [Gammaproteobacteria bacterium]|nr:SDR family oxidoreductase [Gammaproteobacteria bacterium]